MRAVRHKARPWAPLEKRVSTWGMCACSPAVAEVDILGHRSNGILLAISVSSLGKRAGPVACVLVLQQLQAGIPVDSNAVGRQAGGV